MEDNILENGIMVNKMEKEFILILTELKEKAFGKMENVNHGLKFNEYLFINLFFKIFIYNYQIYLKFCFI